MALYGDSFRSQRRVRDGFAPSSLAAKRGALHVPFKANLVELPSSVNTAMVSGAFRGDIVPRGVLPQFGQIYDSDSINKGEHPCPMGLFLR